jgi:hypothetical protein
MAGVFVNYRRADSSDAAHAIAGGLQRRFGARQVFIDVEDIGVGEDWAAVIQHRLGQMQALIAIIGPDWLAATDHEGTQRLFDPTDTVRREIASALASGIAVVPVLVDGATMPRTDQLPPDLRELTRYNALIAGRDLKSDIARLAEAIEDELTVRTLPARAGGATLYGWTLLWGFIAFNLVSVLTTDCFDETATAPAGPRVVTILVFIAALALVGWLRRRVRARRGGRRVATTAVLYLLGPIGLIISTWLGTSIDN